MFDYNGRIRDKWRLNFRSNKLSEGRIKSYCERTGYDPRAVHERIVEDEMFRWCFVVDPIRQNVFEKIAAEHIESMTGISSFKKYGTNDLFIVAGALKEKKELKGMRPESKSIDFSWKYDRRNFYASHKYTNESGGAQDNQYRDVQRFIEDANKIGGRDIFVAIVDGEYYNTWDSQAEMTRRKRLEQMANQNNVFVKSIDELEEFLSGLG